MFFWFGPHTQKVAHHWSKETFLQNLVQITKMGKQKPNPNIFCYI